MTGRAYAHFVGIGGAGMSGIAKVLHDRGVVVTGSDIRLSRYAAMLRDAGVEIAIGHDAANLGDPEIVVMSSAIPDANPEVMEARRRGIPVWPRAKMLAALAGEQSTVAVAGTHGKTSTSSMVVAAMKALGLDPTFLIGGEIREIGTNAGCGGGEHYVVEADESDGSFMYLDPRVAIVTNVEADHLDHYETLERVVDAFRAFLGKVDPSGVAVVCGDDPVLTRLIPGCGCRTVTYGRAAGSDVVLTDVVPGTSSCSFAVGFPDARRLDVTLGVPGEHMALNATGVLAAVWAMGLDPAVAADGLAAFSGVKRRFEPIGEAGGVAVVDDYAHHPTEIRATLRAARQSGRSRVWVVFQPHRYSRTAAFERDFGDAFEDADRVVLMDVYGAGESPVPGVSGKTVLDSLLLRHPRARAAYFPHAGDVAGYVAGLARPGDLVMTMGAGDVTGMGPEIVRELVRRGGAQEVPACR